MTRTTGRPTGRPRGRGGTVAAVTAALLVVAALVWLARPSGGGTPLDPRGTGPTGTRAMFDLVGRLGADVQVTNRTPADAAGQTLVVLADRFDDEQRAAVRARVRDGARLVLFDPFSPLNPVPVRGVMATDMFGVLGESPQCPLLDGVADRVESARWAELVQLPDTTAACYPVGDGWGLVAVGEGDGEVVVTGAVDALVNRTIVDASHARLAAALLVPEGRGTVTVLWDVTVGGGDTPLLSLLPRGVRRGAIVLGIGAVLFALSRARRHGPPVPERLPVRVPASELVLAIGNLLGRHGHRNAAAARLRDDLRREVALALQVPADTSPDLLAELLVARLGDGRLASLDEQGVRLALLDGPVVDDEALVAVTAALARVRARLRSAGTAAGAGAGAGAGGSTRQ